MDDRGDVATFSHCDVTMTTYHDISTIRAGLHCDIEMPTSSQAMILKSRHLDKKFTDFRKLCESERASPVSSVDLNDLFKESCRAVGEEFLKCYLKGSKEKVRAKLIKLLENEKLISKLQEAATTSGNHSGRAGSDEQVAHRVRPKTSVPAAHRSPREERSRGEEQVSYWRQSRWTHTIGGAHWSPREYCVPGIPTARQKVDSTRGKICAGCH